MAIKFAGFAATTALTLTLLGAAPAVAVSSWGTPDDDTIQIVVERTSLKCAPDVVRMSVDLTNSGFDTVGPSGGEIYDARHHKLIYLWDTKDTGSFSAPVNVLLSAWMPKSVAYGPNIAHCYGPGAYEPSVLVIEPSSGKTRTAKVRNKIVVQPSDDVHPTAQTVCVSTSGTFDGKPTGAEEVTTTNFDAAWATYANSGNPVRWLFRRGETFTGEIDVTTANSHVSFGAFGEGADPIIDVPATGNITLGITSTAGVEVRIEGVAFTGTYDPTAEAPPAGGGTTAHSETAISQLSGTLIVSECSFSGFCYSTFTVPTTATAALGVLFSDCVMTNFGGQYPNFIGWLNNADSWFSYVGCRIAQNVDAVDASGMKAPLRVETAPWGYIAKSDWFSTDSTQPVWKIQESNFADGGLINLNTSSLEGPGNLIRVLGNTGEDLLRSTVHNIVIDSLIEVGGYNTQAFLLSNSSGITKRNCLDILPASPRFGTSEFRRFNRIGDVGTYGSSVADAPVEIYNNTCRMDRTVAENNGVSGQVVLAEYYPSLAFNDVSEINNILLLTDDTDDGPLSTTALWTPRVKGYRYPLTVAPDQVLAGNVATSGSLPEIAYWTLYNGEAAVQGDFSGTAGNAAVYIVDTATWYYEADGDISVVYGASGMTVTNLHADTWSSGHTAQVYGDMGTTAPLDTTYETPAGAVMESKPQTGSPALGGATSGDRAWLDLSGAARLEGSNEGTIDSGAWQVTV